jgi:pSer/pThr/pTyr-binding forkhead associated (FHA) protein
MDLLDIAIFVLRMAFVALLYVFLWMVMRFAVGGLRQAPATSVVEPRASTAQAATPRLRLVVLEAGTADLSPGEAFDVNDGVTLGRSTEAEMIVNDAAVSAVHARISRVGRAWLVADLGSTNGTRVNDRPVNGDTALGDGDVLGVGNVRLKVVAR